MADSQNTTPDTISLAAIDLGSNSFHMAIARQHHGQLQLLDKLHEKVQLAEGLDTDKMITAGAETRALDCLDRFKQRLQGLPEGSVRVVGTNTFRVAKNAYPFIRKAEQVLGYPIEVISGREEARLIYLGIAHTCADDQQGRLVIDIGGGSTECIIGSRFEPIVLDSLHMGCVRFKRFFPNNTLSRQNLERAIGAARLEIASIKATFRRQGWQECLGASGSIKSIQQVCHNAGLCDEGITRDALNKLYGILITQNSADTLTLPGLKADRRRIFAPGFAILYALFEQLDLDNMHFADGALREGVLYDLVGRLFHEDVRDRAVKTLQQRHSADMAQAARVQTTAQTLVSLLQQNSPDTMQQQDQANNKTEKHHSAQKNSTDAELETGHLSESAQELLSKACTVHEVGLAISHAKFHRHSAYLIEHSDLPGFSQQEQAALALLVRNHRRKLHLKMFDQMPHNAGFSKKALLTLTLLLRLATVLNRARADREIRLSSCTLSPTSCTLTFEDGWLSENPLIALSLNEEADFLASAGITLTTR